MSGIFVHSAKLSVRRKGFEIAIHQSWKVLHPFKLESIINGTRVTYDPHVIRYKRTPGNLDTIEIYIRVAGGKCFR